MNPTNRLAGMNISAAIVKAMARYHEQHAENDSKRHAKPRPRLAMHHTRRRRMRQQMAATSRRQNRSH